MSKPKAVCPFDPAYTNEDSLLTIDAHAHVFNATDLPVKEFINRISANQHGGIGQLAKYFGGVLQTIAWSAAPDTAEETLVLASLKPDILACDSNTHVASLKRLREDKYTRAVRELQDEAERRLPAIGLSSAGRSRSILSLPPESQGINQIVDLPATYEEFTAQLPITLTSLSDTELRKVSLNSALKFVIEMFQYRFVSVYNYLGAYSAESDQKVDLLTPALVDYDWWLAKGAPTRSTLPKQLRLMQEISILSGGRVHALVPFDPFRQVVHDLGHNSGFSPIELVRTAINENGAIGIKLYPPMGFAPFGNSSLDVWQDKDWLDDIARRSDFPARLDASMDQLLEYCDSEQVPVMGHSNRSNGPSEDFELLTDPQYWQQAAAAHSGVSLSFGHFGGAGSDSDGSGSQVEAFLDLMVADNDRGNQRLHADASYFSTLLENPAQLETTLERIFRYGPAESRVAIDRLMFGTDWKMLTAEVRSEHYLQGFASVIRSIEGRLGTDTNLAAKFFGLNAARFFGLTRGSKNRARLENFYDRHDMHEALWMTKVDRG